jgi:hypothetical protein
VSRPALLAKKNPQIMRFFTSETTGAGDFGCHGRKLRLSSRPMKLPHPFLPVAVLVVTSTWSAAQGPTPVIPDYSQVERSQVPEEFKFNVGDLFKDEAAWRAEFTAVKQLTAAVDGLAREWTNSPRQMAERVGVIPQVPQYQCFATS